VDSQLHAVTQSAAPTTAQKRPAVIKSQWRETEGVHFFKKLDLTFGTPCYELLAVSF
jgi:hypothetical protein